MWYLKPWLDYLSHSHKASRQINFKSYLEVKFMKIFPGDNICCHMFC